MSWMTGYLLRLQCNWKYDHTLTVSTEIVTGNHLQADGCGYQDLEKSGQKRKFLDFDFC